MDTNETTQIKYRLKTKIIQILHQQIQTYIKN